jgi:hypothetical protein
MGGWSRVFFAPGQSSVERAGMNRDSKMASDRLRRSFAPADILPAVPTLDEVENFLGALVVAPRSARARQQSGNAFLLERLIGDIEGLPADAKRFGHLADRAPLDAVAAQHFVLDLHTVARIEEVVLADEGLVAHVLRTRMERARRTQGRHLGIVWRSLRHGCQSYYIQLPREASSP